MTPIVSVMSRLPSAKPDAAKIRQLIWDRGYGQAEFARMIGRSPAMMRRALDVDGVVEVRFIRQLARGLSTSREVIKPSDISDWTGDDWMYDDPPAQIPA